MTTLILFVVLAGIAFIGYKFWRLHAEHNLRYSEPPPRTFIEIALPRDVNDAERRMQNFYRKVAGLTTADDGARREGKGQLDVIFFVDVPRGHMTPLLRFILACDPEKTGAVKRAIKSSFQGLAQIQELEGDPLQDVLDFLQAEMADKPEEDRDPDVQPAKPAGPVA